MELFFQVEDPFKTDEEGTVWMWLWFDLSGFKPEELTVKTEENTLWVVAKQEEKKSNKAVQKEFTKEYAIPDTVDQSTLKAWVSESGVLNVQAKAWIGKGVPPPSRLQTQAYRAVQQ